MDEENISIKNFVKDGKITFLKIPIITEDEESEFLKAYDVLEDYQEALDKIGNYEAINIWGDEDEFEDYDFIIEESSESIIGGYTLGGFRNQFHHGSLTPVKPEIIKKGLSQENQMLFCLIMRKIHLKEDLVGKILIHAMLRMFYYQD